MQVEQVDFISIPTRDTDRDLRRCVGDPSPVPGVFSGGVVVYRADGSVRETQDATLTSRAGKPGAVLASVRFKYLGGAVCTHQLRLTRIIRRGVEYAYDVPSISGMCIPSPKRYRVYWLDRRRVTFELTYPDGVTISGLLFRR